MLAYEVFSLNDLFQEGADDDVLAQAVREALSNFKCSRSSTIHKFITEKVFPLEKSGWTRTYVFLSAGPGGSIQVPAFFSLGLTSINTASDGINKSGMKKLLGATPQGRQGLISCYCIAELARDDSFSADDIPGSVILDEAKNVIASTQSLCGGRLVALDARQKLFDALYSPAGFKTVDTQRSPNDEDDEDFVIAVCKITDWRIS